MIYVAGAQVNVFLSAFTLKILCCALVFSYLIYSLNQAFSFHICPCILLSEVSSAALPDLRAEAVSAAEGSKRSLHRGHQLLQSHPHGHQFPTGTGMSCHNS